MNIRTMLGAAALLAVAACTSVTDPGMVKSQKKANKDAMTGYLVATGLEGALACRVGETDYAEYSGGETEGDPCTVVSQGRR
jgi:hypothetical protein